MTYDEKHNLKKKTLELKKIKMLHYSTCSAAERVALILSLYAFTVGISYFANLTWHEVYMMADSPLLNHWSTPPGLVLNVKIFLIS